MFSILSLEGCYVGFSVGAGTATETHRDKHRGKIEHVVLVWLKEPGNPTVIEKLIELSGEFKRIPGVISVSAGRPVQSSRHVVDSTFDVGVVIEFENKDALQQYEQHPIHVKAVRESLAPNTARMVVYDIEL